MEHRHYEEPESEADQHDEESALYEYMTFRDKQAKVESHRWAGYSERQPAVQVLDILKESSAIFRKHNGVLLAVALALAVPLSTLLLSHILLLLPCMEYLVRTVQLAAERRFHNQTGNRRLAEMIISNAIDIPFSALFSPLVKGAVAYAVATTYGRKKLKLEDVLDNLQKTWSLLLQTFLWTAFSVYLTLAIAFATVFWFASRVGGESITFFGTLGLLIATLTGLTLTVGVAFANVACNLAYVTSVLEGIQGREALVQSVRLLKGKLEVSLLLFLVSNLNGTLLDVLFEFHVIRSDASIVYDKYWEAPLIVCMYSFVHLFDAIMISVLYFMCKSSEADSRIQIHPAVEHFAIAVNDLADIRSPGLQARGSPLATSRSSFVAP